MNGGNDRRGGDDDCGVTFAATKSSMTQAMFWTFVVVLAPNYVLIRGTIIGVLCYIHNSHRSLFLSVVRFVASDKTTDW